MKNIHSTIKDEHSEEERMEMEKEFECWQTKNHIKKCPSCRLYAIGLNKELPWRIKVKKESRKNIYIPERKSLKDFIVSKKFKKIHNFIPTGTIMLGADHDVKSVLDDVEKASRMAIFTDPNANMGHSLALIFGSHEKGTNEKLECYDIGKLTKEDLEITKNLT